jgi:PAS domain S-box-containing protein
MKLRKPEISFSILCLLAGFAWIFVSRLVLSPQKFSDARLHQLDKYADALFVFLASIIIYFGIRFYRKRFLASESRYRVLFDTCPLPLWIFDTNGSRFVLVNTAMTEKYGYSRRELLSMSPVEIRPPEDIPLFLNFLEQIKEGIVDAGIWTHKKKNGERFTVQITTTRINFEKKACLLVVADDITELIKKENEIERLSLVAKHTINGIIITGKERRIEWVNDAFIKMTGFGLEEVLGKVPTDILHGAETDKQTEEEMKALIAAGKSYSGEVLNYKKDGSRMWVQTTASPVEVNGTVDKYVAIFTDITERKKHEDLISQQNARLKDIAFASSHLIRAPLANILGLTDLLQENHAGSDQVLHHLKSSAHKLDEVIREMVSQSSKLNNEAY